MTLKPKDRKILRDLARKQAEVAADPVQARTAELWRRVNDRNPARPTVWINEICWHELEDCEELQLRCEDPWARSLEQGLRRLLYQWEHLPADMIVEPVLGSPVVLRDTGFGVAEKSELLHITPGSVASRHFEPVIREPADIEKIRMPDIAPDPKATAEQFARRQDLFGDILDVQLRGRPGTWFAPWDFLIRLWGVEEAMMDMVLRPEMVHAAMDRLVAAYLHRLDQWEAFDALARNDGNVRIGSGGLGYTDDLPGEPFDAEHVRAHNLWGCATAQIFSDVSPDMHEEFALQYERRWLQRFGLAYYGCCEPLHDKLGILKSVPNLRKISMSPWADVAGTVEQVGTRYVLSIKPSPAILAGDDWSPQRARSDLENTLKQAQGCASEIIMKDISTVRRDPHRLWEWARLAVDVAESFGT